MPRFLQTVARGLFYPAVIIAITIALAANHHTSAAAAATRGITASAKHREPVAHIAKALRGAKVSKHREPVAHIAKALRGAKVSKHREPVAHIAKAPKGAKRARVSQKAKSGRSVAGAASALPTEGIFGGCEAGDDPTDCEANLSTIHAAGFDVDVASVGGSLTDMSQVAAYAQSIGMSIMWEINDPGFWGGAWAGSSAPNDFPAFSAACGCTSTSQILTYMIQYLSSLPGTYGYYAADDELLTPDESDGLTQYVDAIKAIDPNHMVMVGSNESQGTSYFSTGATIGNEIYPQTTGSVMPYEQNLGTWQAVEESITQDQNAADATGTQSAYILQAFTFGDNLTDGEAVGVCTPSMSQSECASKLPYPSAAAQLEMRNEILTHANPKLILWYDFDETFDQGNRWAGLQQAINAPAPVVVTAPVVRANHAKATIARANHAKATIARAKQARERSASRARADQRYRWIARARSLVYG